MIDEKKLFKNPLKESTDIKNKGFDNLKENWDKKIQEIGSLTGEKK